MMHMIWSLNLNLFIVILFVFCLCSQAVTQESSSDNDQTCTVITNGGQIRGKLNRTLFDELPYYSFRGIPFGKPPVGDLRFKAPQKAEQWNSTLDAFDFGNDCIQPNPTNDKVFFGFEDCLNLNVFVPNKCSMMNSKTKMPVVFYILGGQFSMGTASFYGPEFLLETNVIIVTMNYRVGPFGFLTLDEPDFSGNMALKDQLLALQWVNENIERFGGDVNNVTLFGHSSGSSSINLLMISPQAQKFFQKAILMSGSALNPFLPRRQDHSPILYNLAEYLHYPISNKNDLIKFLQQIDAIQFYQETYQQDYVSGFGRKSFNRIWTPCIEDENAVSPFLTQAPFDIVSNESYQNNFDTLYSSSPLEVALTDEGQNPALLKPFDEMFEIQLPLELAHIDFNSEEYKNISDKIRGFYFDGKHVDADTLDNMNLLMTDSKFLYAIDLNARIQAAKSTGRTYFAKFTATNDWSYSQRKAKDSNFTITYPTHSDQLFYVFRFTAYQNIISEQDYQNLSKDSLPGQIIRNLTNFYMNFAKFGNPLPDSEPLYFKTSDSSHYNFFNITNDGIFMQEDPNHNRMEFWNNIFNEFKHLWNTTFDFSL